ncbi:hypothetical protein [Yoonia sp.]|uniref:hypothetical protein n=1 Tax=Yoonia sp. TaxID=2212373 RepID=UPI002DF751D9|nr:hypothetical protein [Yoonia sp.]
MKMVAVLSGAIMFGAPGLVWAQEGPVSGDGAAAETATASGQQDGDLLSNDDRAPLIALFLSDPEAFLDARDADAIAAFIERLITDDPGAIGAVLTALDRATDQRSQGAIADGIARAVARLSAEGRDAASAGLLARIAIEGSAELLRSVVESSEQYSAEVAAEGLQESFADPVGAEVIVAPEIISAPADPPPIVGAGSDGGSGDSGRDALSPVTNAPGIDDGRANTASSLEETPVLGGIASFPSSPPASPVATN